MKRGIRRPVIAGLLLASQVACYGPTRHYSLGNDFTVAENKIVHVTLHDGTVVRLSSPRVVLDSLLTGWSVEDGKAIGHPLTAVRSVEGRERSKVRTALLAGGLATALLAGIIVATGGNRGTSGIDSLDTED